MRAIKFFFEYRGLFILILLLFTSCSKESIEDPAIPAVDAFPLVEELQSSTDAVSLTCIGIDQQSEEYYNEVHVTTGNGNQYKTLLSYTVNSTSEVRVRANYVASVKNQRFPATIVIDIGGEAERFSGVTPGQSVTSTFNLEDWEGGYSIPIVVEQRGFLQPAVISYDYEIIPSCPPVIGEERFGGIVVDVYNLGAIRYGSVVYGLVAAPHNLPPGNWETAMENSEDLVIDTYDDWYLPGSNELMTVMKYGNIPHEEAVWTSATLFPGDEAFAGISTGVDYFGNFLRPYHISSILDARPVRQFSMQL